MAQHDNILTVKKIKRNGKLEFVDKAFEKRHQMFVDAMDEGQEVTIFYESDMDDGTNDQLAKIHAYIRKIAANTGCTFHETKMDIKVACGFVQPNYVKSFGRASRDELGLVIEHIKNVCDVVGIPYI